MGRFCVLFSCLVLSLCVMVYSKDEAPVKQIQAAFKEMDKDGDGKVTREEVVLYMEKKKSKPEANHFNIADSIFDFYDKNQDGHISLQEFLPHDEL